MATVKFNLEADEQKAVQAFLRVVDAQQKTEDGFRRSTRAAQDHSSSLDEIGTKLATVATAYFGISAAIDQARQAMEMMRKEQEQGAERLAQSESSGSKLVQLAQTSEDLKKMLAQAESYSVNYGMTPEAARQLQFEMSSIGSGQGDMYASLQGIFDDPAKLAHAMATSRRAFGGGARSERATLNGAVLAAGPESIDVEGVAIEGATTAPGIAQLGGSPEENDVLLSMLASARKSTEQAATEIRSLSKVAMNKGFGGSGLINAMGLMQQGTEGKSGKGLVKYFEDQEALRGFQTLSPLLGTASSRVASIQANETEGPGDPVARMMSMRDAVPELAGPRSRRILAQGIASTKMQQFGDKETERQTMIDAIEKTSLESNEPFYQRYARLAAAKMGAMYNAEPSTILRLGSRAGDADTFTSLGDKFMKAGNAFERAALEIVRASKTQRNHMVE